MANHPGGLNRTGAGFHADSRREGRMSRAESRRRAVLEDLRDLVIDESEPGFWQSVPNTTDVREDT